MSDLTNSSKVLQLIRMTEQVKINEKLKSHLSNALTTNAYWKTVGANILILPRQVGKTTALKRYGRILAESNPDEAVLMLKLMVDTNEFVNDIENFVIAPVSKWLTARAAFRPYRGIHLLIDEFCYLRGTELDAILNNDWLSVTMISSMK